MILYILKKYANNRIKKNNLWKIKKFSFSDTESTLYSIPYFYSVRIVMTIMKQ